MVSKRPCIETCIASKCLAQVASLDIDGSCYCMVLSVVVLSQATCTVPIYRLCFQKSALVTELILIGPESLLSLFLR